MLCWCLFSTGCSWNAWRSLQGEGFHDEMAGTSKNLRNQKESDGTPLGMSQKAREIESNLGYR